MKRTLIKSFVAVLAMSATIAFSSCKEEDENNPIDVSVETPRYMAAANGDVYVTCYYPMSVIRFDPSQNAITGICELGQYHPEGIAAVGGKLYVASSNISDENYNYSYDNKLYVIDIASFTVSETITVGVNPAKVKKLDNNHIVYNTLGDYATDFGGTYIMNTDTKEITSLGVALTNFDVYDGDIYGYATTYNPDYSTSDVFYKIDGTSHQTTTILGDWSASDGAYGISLNPHNGDIIVTTNGNYVSAGDCYVFTNDGTPRMNAAVQVGNLPSKAVAIDNDNLLILNEGSWGANNAGVSRVNVSNGTATVKFFEDNNGRGLGDVAQDMIINNGKAFITVSFSNSIETMNPNTGKSTRFATAE